MRLRTQIEFWVVSAIILLWIGGILQMVYGSEAMYIPRILIIGTYFIGLISWAMLNILPDWMIHEIDKSNERLKERLDFSVTPAESVVNKEDI